MQAKGESMIIVGEKINTSRKSIAEAVERRDAAFIVNVAREQLEAGLADLDERLTMACWIKKPQHGNHTFWN